MGTTELLPASEVTHCLPARLPSGLMDHPRHWSIDLVVIVNSYLHPHPDVPLCPVTAAIRAEAEAELEDTRPLRHRAPVQVLNAFLVPLAGAVEFTPTESEYVRRFEALHAATGHVPHIAWTLEAQKDLMLSCRRLPSVAQIVETVVAPIQSFISVTNALQRIAKS